MIKQLKWGFAIAILAGIGVFGFQLNWLSQNYELSKENFKQEVDEALNDAVNAYYKDRTSWLSTEINSRFPYGTEQKFESYFKKDSSAPSAFDSVLQGNSTLVIRVEGDSAPDIETITQRFANGSMGELEISSFKVDSSSEKMEEMLQMIEAKSEKAKTDKWGDSTKEVSSVVIKVEDDGFPLTSNTIIEKDLGALKTNAKSLGGFVDELIPRLVGNLLDNGQLDKQKLDSLFNVELQNKGLGVVGEVIISSGDSLSNSFPTKTDKLRHFTVANNLNFQASVSDFEFIIVQRMWASILGSFTLLILLFFSFYIMLRIIFQQKKMNEVKNDFINNMTHEFKTPLASIYAAIEAMLNFGALEDKNRAERYLNLAQGEVNRLNGMVQQILNAAVNETQEIELERESCDVAGMIQNLVEKQKINPFEDN